MKIEELISKLEIKYPLENQEPWDFSGLAFRNKKMLDNYLSGILLCLDITNEVIDYAIENNLNLIISHHPFIFNNYRKRDFIAYPYKEQIYKKAIKNKIVLYSLHTNYDVDKEGTSFQIAKQIFDDNNFKIKIESKYSTSIYLNQDINEIENKLHLKNFKILNSNLKDQNFIFKKLIIFAGSGDYSEISELASKDDLVITSDIKWNEWIFYNQNKLNVIEVSHRIEEVFIFNMKEIILNKLKLSNIKVETYTFEKWERTN
ncbi:hypothetical protein CJJ23_02030 [Mycoplasmopsis agassizii]|uniref:GTP cyclohydrolase 1 type 2 homolog n=1 Tax=Mycoplasmopsis agassizii TaxID=33922 RepID=A0A269TKD7_9BACT|nr:Nif3-like dinuclear metal center hexameric protein [Mycoplasmopsis agassizii]PAK21408.1 hypothetical protein CJJ23_02030 [Mycoplasmopsis agassizii]